MPGFLLLAILSTALLQHPDEQLIRAARERSNAAIARHDLDAIGGVWLDDVHVLSSTSAQTAGKNANRERMAAQFKSRPDTVYVRTPVSIEVYAAWNVASERGAWTGKWTEPDGVVEIGGTYQGAVAESRWPLADPGRAIRAGALQGQQVLPAAPIGISASS